MGVGDGRTSTAAAAVAPNLLALSERCSAAEYDEMLSMLIHHGPAQIWYRLFTWRREQPRRVAAAGYGLLWRADPTMGSCLRRARPAATYGAIQGSTSTAPCSRRQKVSTCQSSFVTFVASVQYRAVADKASDAFYKISNTREHIIFERLQLLCVVLTIGFVAIAIIVQDLADIDVFLGAKSVIDSLRNNEIAPALAWCAESKS